MLSVSIVLPIVFKGCTRGLLGNFDENPDNDFMFSNGTTLSSNISEREIYNYGQTWEVDAERSVFMYPTGKNHSDYHFRHFVPKFLGEANPEKVTNAKERCGEDNQECIFDLVFTENEAVANNTRSLDAQASTGQAEIGNRIPTISGNGTVHATVNETIIVQANATDDGSFTYHLLYNTANATSFLQIDNSTIVTFVLQNEDPVYVSIIAEDSRHAQSLALDIDIYLCSGCSKHGRCDFSQPREDNRSMPHFKYAVCICDPFWQGDNCDIDFDGCASRPCSPLRNCTDTPALFHQMSNSSYNCSACPKGYTNGVVDTSKCTDNNECNTTSHGCAQTCVNTDGSYYCACNTTFRLHPNGKDCQDINECLEGAALCDQDCNNTYGGYVCTCKMGYTYNITQTKCVAGDPIPECTSTNCSQSDGCTLDAHNKSTCFCRAGYRLTDVGTCADINECEKNICSHGCENRNGSFKCACFSGYSLGNDGVSCNLCSYPSYGENCSYTCNCGRGAERCDPVKGCICATGWTGSNCDIDVNECSHNPNICKDTLKSCFNVLGSYNCPCIHGYTAINNTCEDISECEDPTLNNCEQSCINTVGGYTCSCESGYNVDEQSKNNCTDIDECKTLQSECEQICENTVGGFSCSCYFGYRLQTDRRSCIEDENPCKKYGDLRCSQICKVDLVKKTAVCGCIQGFKLGADNQTCIDINECTDFNGTLNHCSINGNCKNTNGTYICSCDLGFRLENDQRTCTACDNFHYGINCSKECGCGIGSEKCDKVKGCVCRNGWIGHKCDADVDECSDSGICTGANVACLNTPGSFQCVCRTGYTKDDKGICQDIDECTKISINDCEQVCTNTDGSYTCSCHSGFLKSETKCIDIDECYANTTCSQICTNTPGNYRCSCNDGYFLNTTDMRTCIPEVQCPPENKTACNSSNALCIVLNGSAQCYCPKGYQNNSEGYCSDIDECTANLRLCSEICTNVNGSYTCSCESGKELATDGLSCVECQEGKYGDLCANSCSCNAPNTEKCNPLNGSCICKPGWEGPVCNINVDECNKTNICPGNSTCRDLNGTYLCECQTGFIKTASGVCAPCQGNHYGKDCKENCLCVSANTLSCDNTNGTCTCTEGWQGLNCSNDIDECSPLNRTICTKQNETCLNTNGSFVCSCSHGFTIDAIMGCVDINECLEGNHTCKQGCQNTEGNFTCVCNAGYSGDGIRCVDIDECSNRICGNNGSCNNTIGSYVCNCTSGWKGLNCTEDIDECYNRTDSCLQVCVNTNGSYNCSCYSGFEGNGDNCSPKATTHSEKISLKFDFTLPLNENLSNNDTYQKYKNYVNETIWNYFQTKLKKDFYSVEIINITPGSLIVLLHIFTPYTDSVTSLLIKYVAEVYKHTFQIGDVNVSVLSAQFGSLSVTNTSDLCDLYVKLKPSCPVCIIEEVTGPTCREMSDSTDLVIGLGVGIPLGVLFVVIVIVVFIYRKKLKKKKANRSDISSSDEGSSITTRGLDPFGLPSRLSRLFRRTHIPLQSKAHYDIASNRPYDDVGTTTGQQNSHFYLDAEYAGQIHNNDEDKQRESNFSWDFVYNYLNPDQKYEIKRPRTETYPNPVYGGDV